MSGALLGSAVIGVGGSLLGSYLSGGFGGSGGAGGMGAYQIPDFSKSIDYLQNNWNNPQYQNYTPTDINQGMDDFLGQSKYFPQVNNFLQKVTNRQNNQYLDDIRKFDPTVKQDARKLASNVSAGLRGELAPDVLGQIQRGTAEQSLFGGFGDSSMARNLTARDLGRTSYDLQNTAAAQLPGAIAVANSLNPYKADALSYFATPQQNLATDIGQNQYGNQVFNTNATNSANIANQQVQQIAGLMTGQAGANASGANTQNLLNYQASQQPNPWASALSTGVGALASSYGGGAAGGGAGGGWGAALQGLFNSGGQGQGQGPYGSTYGGTYNSLPVYRPQAV